MPMAPRPRGVATATMVSRPGLIGRPPPSGDRFAAGGGLDGGAILLDVLLHRLVLELQVAQDAGIDALERRRLLVPAEPEAHLQHRSPEQTILQRLGFPHPSPLVGVVVDRKPL